MLTYCQMGWRKLVCTGRNALEFLGPRHRHQWYGYICWGGFSDAGGDPNADCVAKWDGTSWSALGTSSLDGDVYAIAINGTDVYVGGGFTTAGGDPNADYIAKWNGVSWSALGATPLNSSNVEAITISGADVYVGGASPMRAATQMLTKSPNGMDQTGLRWGRRP